MTLCQTLTLDYEDEMKNTRKLLERVPLDDAHRGFKPHPKSMAFDALATHVAGIPGWIKMALDSELLQLEPGTKFDLAATSTELMAMFDKAVGEGRAAIASAPDEAMHKNWTFRFGD